MKRNFVEIVKKRKNIMKNLQFFAITVAKEGSLCYTVTMGNMWVCDPTKPNKNIE